MAYPVTSTLDRSPFQEGTWNPTQEPPQDCWKFAALEPMVEFIRLAMRSGFTPDPDIPLQIQPCRRTAELAIKRALEP